MTAHDGSHGRIEAEPFRVVDIIVTGQTAIGRLQYQAQKAMLGVLAGAGVCSTVTTVLVSPMASSSSR